MKKIFSILLALTLVLGLTAMATPALADEEECEAAVTLDTDCAGKAAEYCIAFNITVTVRAGTDSFVIDFPAGTAFPDEWASGDITVDDGTVYSVPKADISEDGTTLTFKSPVAISASTGDPEEVTICVDGIINPAAEGEYTLTVGWLEGCCDYEELVCGEYEIVPLKSTYKFVVDFGPDVTDPYPTAWDGSSNIDGSGVVVTEDDVYTGIAKGFVPPFKACGQDGFGWEHPDGHNFTAFYLWLMADDEGCEGYDDVIVYFELTEAPEDATVSLYLWGINATPNATLGWHLFELTMDDEEPYRWGLVPDGFTLLSDHEEPSPGLIHFDEVGDYEICFWAKPKGLDPCTNEPFPNVAELCAQAHAYQWKDAGYLELDEKWNLISLPLVPFETDIDKVLAAYPYPDDIVSVWYYDAAEGEWYVHGVNTAFQTLETMEDGKAYWVRMLKDAEDAESDYTEVLWVWGTANKMPPYSPASYDLVPGWNMVGFTSLADDGNVETGYLEAVWAEVAKIYGWTAGVPGAWVEDPTAWNVGEGFWVSFTEAATVFP